MSLEFLSVLLAGGSLAVSLAVLIVVWSVMRDSRRSRAAGDERLEILREQQARLKVMYQERDLLREELRRLRSVMDEETRVLELPAPTGPESPERHLPWWRRWFGG